MPYDFIINARAKYAGRLSIAVPEPALAVEPEIVCVWVGAVLVETDVADPPSMIAPVGDFSV